MNREIGDVRPWVRATVDALNDCKSWTGRIHIHKTLFIAKVLHIASPPIEFHLYLYGPYSADLDDALAEMDAFGYLDKRYRKPGYGPSYECTSLSERIGPFVGQEDCEALRRVAKVFGTMKGADLELAATCLWVERCEEEKDNDRIVERVEKLKPRFDANRIREALADARNKAAELTGE